MTKRIFKSFLVFLVSIPIITSKVNAEKSVGNDTGPKVNTGGSAGNGGGPAELNFMIAALNLFKYLKLCLASSTCNLTPSEADLVRAINTELASIKPETLLTFLSQKDDPFQFMINGVPRIARTGSKVGDQIFINKDLIYFSDPLGKSQPLSLSRAAGTLIHEFAHHHEMTGSELDESKLEALGAKIDSFVNTKVTQLENLSGTRIIILDGVWGNEPIDSPRYFNPQIYIEDKNHFASLPQSVFESVSKRISNDFCNNHGPNPGKLYGIRFSNVHITSKGAGLLPVHSPSNEAFLLTNIHGNLEFVCGSEHNLKFDGGQLQMKITIKTYFETSGTEGTEIFLNHFAYRGELKYEILDCLKSKNKCH